MLRNGDSFWPVDTADGLGESSDECEIELHLVYLSWLHTFADKCVGKSSPVFDLSVLYHNLGGTFMGQTACQTREQTFVQLTFCSPECLIITSHYGLIKVV